MNVPLAKWMLGKTPENILHPSPDMNVNIPLNTLNTAIPALGLGTWQSEPGQVEKAVAHALKAGYRHIDCAYCYANEDEVGEGLKEGMKAAGLKREDIFVTTKLSVCLRRIRTKMLIPVFQMVHIPFTG